MTKRRKSSEGVPRHRLVSEIAAEFRKRTSTPGHRVRSAEPVPGLQGLASKALNNLVESWSDALLEEKPVVLRGFGSFEVRTHPPRIFRMPDGSVMHAGERQTVAFSASPKLKQAIRDHDAAEQNDLAGGLDAAPGHTRAFGEDNEAASGAPAAG